MSCRLKSHLDDESWLWSQNMGVLNAQKRFHSTKWLRNFQTVSVWMPYGNRSAATVTPMWRVKRKFLSSNVYTAAKMIQSHLFFFHSLTCHIADSRLFFMIWIVITHWNFRKKLFVLSLNQIWFWRWMISCWAKNGHNFGNSVNDMNSSIYTLSVAWSNLW